MMLQAVASLNNDACSLILNGSNGGGAIQLLNSALVAMKRGIIEAEQSNSSGVHNQQSQLSNLHPDTEGMENKSRVGRGSSFWSEFAPMEARLLQSKAIAKTPCDPYHPSYRNISPEAIPASSSMYTIFIRPLMMLMEHEDASLYVSSMIVMFNLALASHIMGIQLLGSNDRKGAADAIRQANRLYRLTLQVYRSQEGDRRRSPLMYPIILNNLSHTHRVLGEPSEALECDRALLTALLDLESRREQVGSGTRHGHSDAGSVDVLTVAEVDPVLDAFAENVRYLYERAGPALGAPAA